MAPTAPQDVTSFVSWVLAQDKNLELVDAEVVTQLQADYTKALEDEINAYIISQLGEDQQKHLESLMDSFGAKDVQDYVGLQIPDLKEQIAAILLRFRDNYLGA